MSFFSKLGSSADLVTGMSDRLGVDFRAAVLRNPDRAAQDYRSMVLRCSSCTDQVDCAERQANATSFDAAPEYCLNKDILERQ